MNGKGSKRRPTFVPLHEFGDNWAKIFEKPKQKEEEKEKQIRKNRKPSPSK